MDLEVSYERDCPGCGETFTAKRLNQKFCDQRCKSQFHNNKSRGVRIREKSKSEITGDANAILWRNREVLKKYVDQHIDLQILKKEGFNTTYITNYIVRDKKTYYQVYDMIYLPNKNKLEIFKDD